MVEVRQLTPLKVTVLTNARAARQPSMLGYGELVLNELQSPRHAIDELRASSFFASRTKKRPHKLLLNLDRFIVTPIVTLGRAADILHVIDPGNVVYVPFTRAKRSIVSVYDMIPHLCRRGELSGFTPSRAGILLLDAINAQLRRSDIVVSSSESTVNDLVRLGGVDRERIRVIPLAVFQPMTRATTAQTEALRVAHGLPADGPLMMHIGRNFYKNRTTVLEIFERVARARPDARLVLVGALDTALAEALGRSPSAAAVTIIDRIATEDLATLYSAASVLLFPSLYEGFGYPVLEAQMCGTPVVCSDRGSLPEVAGDAAFVHDPHEVEALTESVLTILSDSAARARLVAAGYANAARFTKERWREAHHRLYDEVAS